MRSIQIIDLDGCISDDRWRRQYIDLSRREHNARFHDYHQSSWLDDIVNETQIIRAAEIVVFTGRPLLFRKATLHWLKYTARIEPLHLIMRNDNDNCGTVALKQRMLHGLFDPNSYNIDQVDVISAIDDRTEVVEMYRRAGIPATLVRIGEEEHVYE